MITIHDSIAFEKMRRAGSLASKCLDMITDFVVPGISTNELDKKCYDFIIKNNAIPACLGYKGYPKTICTSINHVICHGIPSDKKLQNGDIINIDVTVIVDEYHGDTSRMFLVGDKVPLKAKLLCQITYDAMMKGIDQVKPGNTLGDIGHAIQSYVEKFRYSVVTDYCGHGIGKIFHDYPSVLHFGEPKTGLVLEPGMCFTIEPMVNIGKSDTLLLSDNWTVVTRDKSLSAQWEHTIGVTETGFEIFTESN